MRQIGGLGSVGASGWCQRHASEIRGLSATDRCLDLVNIAFEVAQKHACADDSSVSCGLFVDVSQSTDRAPWSQNGLRALTTGCEVFAFSLKRTLHPVEHLSVMGFQPPIKTDGLSVSQIRDLAGEGMAMPSIAMALISVLTSLSGKEKVRRIVSLFARNSFPELCFQKVSWKSVLV